MSDIGLISYDVPLDEDLTLLDLLGVYQNPIDNIVKRDQILKVMKIIKLLKQEEIKLILDLFFYEKTEQEIANQCCISRQAINKRKQKIINKIKKMLKSGC